MIGDKPTKGWKSGVITSWMISLAGTMTVFSLTRQVVAIQLVEHRASSATFGYVR